MIEVLFEFGNETILVVIKGKDVQFGSTTYGAQLADISGMKLSYDGAVKEFPDLAHREDWQEEATLRFKDHIIKLNSEEKVYHYIVEELRSYGYKPMTKKMKGHRPVKIK